VRNTKGGLSKYNGKIEQRFNSNQVDWLLEAPCDILVPAARPDAITARNADRIQCKVILQGANTPINKMTEYYLHNRRGIISLSDFIVNSGGIIGCAVELTMKSNTEYKKKVEAQGIRFYTENLINNTIAKNVTQVQCQVTATNEVDIPRMLKSFFSQG
jgi:glutamate dehydrogenase/leucine dehydrogenase